eukprot:4459221-Lingulodinium_polyedra.AAC.1
MACSTIVLPGRWRRRCCSAEADTQFFIDTFEEYMKLSGTRDLVALLYRIVASPTCKSFEAVTLMAEHAELVKAIVSKAPQARVSHVHMVAALKQMHARKPCIFAN